MSNPTPIKPLVVLAEIKTPPLGSAVRRHAGFLLWQVQTGVALPFPINRPMPSIGAGVHELRLSDESGDFRIVYAVRAHIVVLGVFAKKSRATPKKEIDACKRRLAMYETSQ